MTLVTLPQETMEKMLTFESGQVEVILDTDTYNEIDDQFAIVYSVLSPERIKLRAITAAPFVKYASSESAASGMQSSYEEILRVLACLNMPHEGLVFRGSEDFLQNKSTPVRSEAVDRIIEVAREPRDTPLYVVSIGAITNVASALLSAPDIAEKITVVWLGGHPHYWPTALEFNLMQDVTGVQVVFDSGVPLVHVPCKNVAEHLRTTVWELEKFVKGQGEIGDYLFRIFCDYSKDHYAWSKEIWDIAPVAWLVTPEWCPSEIATVPELLEDMTWRGNDSRHCCRVLTDLHRDMIFRDLFDKLKQYSQTEK